MLQPYSEDLIGYFPDYLSALSRTLLRFCWTTFVEAAVYNINHLMESLSFLEFKERPNVKGKHGVMSAITHKIYCTVI